MSRVVASEGASASTRLRSVLEAGMWARFMLRVRRTAAGDASPLGWFNLRARGQGWWTFFG